MHGNYRTMEIMGLWNSKIISLWNWNASQYDDYLDIDNEPWIVQLEKA